MNVTYTVNHEPFSMIVESDDLAELTTRIHTHIRQSHPSIATDPTLLTRVTDGLLNSLADDQDEVALGELAN